MSPCVSRICAHCRPRRSSSSSYRRIRRLWPAAAAACFNAISCGRCLNWRRSTPSATAPLDTTTGVRSFATTARSSQSRANFRRSSDGGPAFPAAPARTVEPSLITGLRHRAREERRELVIRFVGPNVAKAGSCYIRAPGERRAFRKYSGTEGKPQQAPARHLAQARAAARAGFPELARHLTELSQEIGRQLGVLINRRGEVEHVIVGDARQLVLPDIGRARAGHARLRGLRLVHTHLKSEPLSKDDLTDLALLRLDLVAAIGVLEEGLPGSLQLAHLVPANGNGH